MTLRPVESEVGQYRVSVRDANDNELHSLVCTATQRFPVIGEALDVFGDDEADDVRRYRIRDVRHVEEDGFSSLRLTKLLVIVHADDGPRRDTAGDEVAATSQVGRHRASSESKPKVLPFGTVSFDPSSPLRAFFALLAGVVVGGYREQSHQFERLKFQAWQLEWAGNAWIVRQLSGGLSAEALRSLSRQAGREADVAANVLGAALATDAKDRRGGLTAFEGGKDRS